MYNTAARWEHTTHVGSSASITRWCALTRLLVIAAVTSVLGDVHDDAVFQRPSANGRWVSVSITASVQNSDQVGRLRSVLGNLIDA